MVFYSEFIKTILSNINNEFSHDENYDELRFGKAIDSKTPIVKIKKKLKGAFEKGGFTIRNNNYNLNPDFKRIESHFKGLELFYNKLEDAASQDLLLQILAYKILGFTKVKLPLSRQEYHDGIESVEKIVEKDNYLQIRFLDWKLYFMDLNKLDIPIKIYLLPAGVYTGFILKQYEYHSVNKVIKVKEGDYVIDAGGCWGDTALYFAREAGKKGKVFSYEFIPSNLEIFNRNVDLNPDFRNLIDIVQRPVWEQSEKPMYFIDNGPGSRVFMDESEKHDGSVLSLSIDDLVASKSIQKIDFIKMDIEGAEPFALKGAENTIKKFKPTLAIAIYHSMDDFVNIPKYIDDLNLGYKFYLGHFSIHEEETILFAEIPNE